MSENVDTVRHAIDAWNRGDTEYLAEYLVEISIPDIEMNPVVAGSITGRVYRGHDGIRRFMRDYNDVFEEFELDGGDAVNFGDRVAWLGRVHATGRDSGIELDHAIGVVIEFQRDKAIQFRSFPRPRQRTEGRQGR